MQIGIILAFVLASPTAQLAPPGSCAELTRDAEGGAFPSPRPAVPSPDGRYLACADNRPFEGPVVTGIYRLDSQRPRLVWQQQTDYGAAARLLSGPVWRGGDRIELALRYGDRGSGQLLTITRPPSGEGWLVAPDPYRQLLMTPVRRSRPGTWLRRNADETRVVQVPGDDRGWTIHSFEASDQEVWVAGAGESLAALIAKKPIGPRPKGWQRRLANVDRDLDPEVFEGTAERMCLFDLRRRDKKFTRRFCFVPQHLSDSRASGSGVELAGFEPGAFDFIHSRDGALRISDLPIAETERSGFAGQAVRPIVFFSQMSSAPPPETQIVRESLRLRWRTLHEVEMLALTGERRAGEAPLAVERVEGVPPILARLWSGLEPGTPSVNQMPGFQFGRGLRTLALRALRETPWSELLPALPGPLFVSGPHQAAKPALADATRFGHYHPETVRALIAAWIPQSRASPLRVATQGDYDTYLSGLARIFFETHQKLAARPDCLNRERDDYRARLRPDAVERFDHGRYYYFLVEGFCAVDDFRPANPYTIHGRMAFNGNIVKTAVGFWLRRSLDGTMAIFFEGLTKLLRAYDPKWLAQRQERP